MSAASSPSGPEKTTRPAASSVTSLHSAARSSIRWLESTTAVPCAASRGQHAMHVTGADRVEAVRRFVEHQQPRPGQQRGGEPEPLAHPEREAADAVVRDVGEPDLLQRVVDAVGAVASQARQRVEVLPGGERRVQARAVDEPRDPVGQRQRPAHRTAEDLQVAAVGLGQPEQQARAASSFRRRSVRPGRAPGPRAMSRSTPSSATTSPKDLLTPARGLQAFRHFVLDSATARRRSGGPSRAHAAVSRCPGSG